VLNLPAQSFTILSPDGNVAVPAGFTETTVNLNGEAVKVWRQDNNGQSGAARQYLIYLMDSRGVKGFYLYNETTQLLSPYLANATTTATSSSIIETAATTAPVNQPAPAAFNVWQLVALLLGLLCLILIGLVIWLAVHGPAHGDEGPDDGHSSRGGRDNAGGHRATPVRVPPIKRVD
jgi:hypothetical protein